MRRAAPRANPFDEGRYLSLGLLSLSLSAASRRSVARARTKIRKVENDRDVSLTHVRARERVNAVLKKDERARARTRISDRARLGNLNEQIALFSLSPSLSLLIARASAISRSLDCTAK